MIESQATFARVVEDFVREELSQENAQIAAAVLSMLDAGGKRLRPRITMLSGLACNAAAPQDPVLASYMELIHIATLIHDDVVDGAQLRRGRPSTNSTQGNRFSVLAGDYLFAWVFKKITQSYVDPIPNILSAMLAEICNGQVRELRAIGDLDLSIDEYREIVGKKTAQLFAACAEVGAIVALQHLGRQTGSAPRDDATVGALRAYGWSLGMAFQIRDDLLDVISSDAELGKPAGSDLREKKVTLPLIYAIEEFGPEFRARIERLFVTDDAASNESAPGLRNVLDELKSGRVVERTRDSIAGYVTAAGFALGALAPSPPRDELAELAAALTRFSA